MKAFYCDKCGEDYLVRNMTTLRGSVGNNNSQYVFKFGPYTTSEVQLCRKCMRELNKWIEYRPTAKSIDYCSICKFEDSAKAGYPCFNCKVGNPPSHFVIEEEGGTK